MSLCIKVEHAFAKYLLTQARFLVTEKGEWIIEENALRIRTAAGFDLTEPVTPSVNDVKPLPAPRIVAECAQMVEMAGLIGSLNFLATVVVSVVYPSSDSYGIPDAIGSFELAAHEVAKALYDPDLPRLLMANEPDLTVFSPDAPDLAGARQEAHVIVGKLRYYQFTLSLGVARGDLTVAPVLQTVRTTEESYG